MVTKERVLELCLDGLFSRKYRYDLCFRENLFPYEDKVTCVERLEETEEAIKYLKEHLT
jgi:hypothetical protein